MSERKGPYPGPRPDYPEDGDSLSPAPRPAKPWKRPTREIPLEDVTRGVRDLLGERLLTRIGTAFLTLMLGGSGAFGYHNHGHTQDLEKQVEQQRLDVKALQEQLTEARVEQARCCPKGEP